MTTFFIISFEREAATLAKESVINVVCFSVTEVSGVTTDSDASLAADRTDRR